MKLAILLCASIALTVAEPYWSHGSPRSPSRTPGRNGFGGFRQNRHRPDFGRHVVVSKRGKVGGYYNKDRHGENYGAHASHEFNNGLSVEGSYDRSSQGGHSYGVSFEKSFGRRMAELESAVRDIQKRQWKLGGYVNKDKQGTNYGGSVSKTWNHRGGSRSSLSGYYGHGSTSGHSAGLKFTHSFGRRESETDTPSDSMDKRETSADDDMDVKLSTVS